MVLLQAIFGLVTKSAGKILNALFGWAVRALFGQTTTREQTYLSVVVGAAVAWPILLLGVVAPKIAALVLAFVPLPHTGSPPGPFGWSGWRWRSSFRSRSGSPWQPRGGLLASNWSVVRFLP